LLERDCSSATAAEQRKHQAWGLRRRKPASAVPFRSARSGHGMEAKLAQVGQ
jgi:hypothetical protein